MSDTVETVADGPGEPASRRRGRSRRWWLAVCLAMVLGASAITVTSVSLRYLHAAALITDGGGWIPPDNAHVVQVRAGRYSASITLPRPGQAQTFEIDLINASPVSQTVVGLTDREQIGDARFTAEPVHLAVSANSEFPATGRLEFTTAPVTLAPRSTHVARVTIDTRKVWAGCRSEYFDHLSLDVRVGIFTRTETVDFGSLIMEIRTGKADCWS